MLGVGTVVANGVSAGVAVTGMLHVDNALDKFCGLSGLFNIKSAALEFVSLHSSLRRMLSLLSLIGGSGLVST